MCVCIWCQTIEGGPPDVSDSFTLVSSIEDLPDDEQTSASLDRQSRLADGGQMEHSELVADSGPVQRLSASPGSVWSNDHDQVCLCVFSVCVFFFCKYSGSFSYAVLACDSRWYDLVVLI